MQDYRQKGTGDSCDVARCAGTPSTGRQSHCLAAVQNYIYTKDRGRHFTLNPTESHTNTPARPKPPINYARAKNHHIKEEILYSAQ